MLMKEVKINEKSRIALQLWIEAEQTVLNSSKSGVIYSHKLQNLNENIRILRKLTIRLMNRQIAYYNRQLKVIPAGYIEKINRCNCMIDHIREYIQKGVFL